jgi:glutathione S-transferase
MQQLLDGRDWFVSSAMTIADIALLAYTRLAHEGGFDLALRPNIRAWIGRSEKLLGLEPAP